RRVLLPVERPRRALGYGDRDSAACGADGRGAGRSALSRADRLERPLESIAQLDLGLPAELLARPRVVERDVLDLALARRRDVRLELSAADVAELAHEVQNRGLAPGADVERGGLAG